MKWILCTIFWFGLVSQAFSQSVKVIRNKDSSLVKEFAVGEKVFYKASKRYRYQVRHGELLSIESDSLIFEHDSFHISQLTFIRSQRNFYSFGYGCFNTFEAGSRTGIFVLVPISAAMAVFAPLEGKGYGWRSAPVIVFFLVPWYLVPYIFKQAVFAVSGYRSGRFSFQIGQ